MKHTYSKTRNTTKPQQHTTTHTPSHKHTPLSSTSPELEINSCTTVEVIIVCLFCVFVCLLIFIVSQSSVAPGSYGGRKYCNQPRSKLIKKDIKAVSFNHSLWELVKREDEEGRREGGKEEGR